MNADSQPDQAPSSSSDSKSGWRKSARQSAWYKTVYGARDTNPNEAQDLQDFRLIAKDIFKRDHYRCQGCFQIRNTLERANRYLTCHHIMPRSEGGGLGYANLLTLCNICHDYVEEHTYRTRGEISGCCTKEQRHYETNRAPDQDWHRWVYGGYRKPS